MSNDNGKKNENNDKNGEDVDNVEVAVEVTDDLGKFRKFSCISIILF